MRVAIVLLCNSRPSLQYAAQLCQLANETYLRDNPNCPHPYNLGVEYRPEPRCEDGDGTHTCEEERFDTIPIIKERGWGDCDDLACALAAWLRVRENQQDARAVVLQHQGVEGRYHAVTQHGNGKIEDPSLRLGMRNYMGRNGGEQTVTGRRVVGDAPSTPVIPTRGAYRMERDPGVTFTPSGASAPVMVPAPPPPLPPIQPAPVAAPETPHGGTFDDSTPYGAAVMLASYWNHGGRRPVTIQQWQQTLGVQPTGTMTPETVRVVAQQGFAIHDAAPAPAPAPVAPAPDAGHAGPSMPSPNWGSGVTASPVEVVSPRSAHAPRAPAAETEDDDAIVPSWSELIVDTSTPRGAAQRIALIWQEPRIAVSEAATVRECQRVLGVRTTGTLTPETVRAVRAQGYIVRTERAGGP